MQAGKLRYRVDVQARRGDSTRNALGELTGEWYTVSPGVWAAIEPLSARESFAAQQAQSTVTHRVTMRYRADLAGGNYRIRWESNGRTRYLYFDGPLTSPDNYESLTGTVQER